MISEIPKAVAMVRPAGFGFNPETAGDNAFQHHLKHFSSPQIQEMALLEFNNMVQLLRSKGIHVHVFDDHKDDGTPDSIFPNNWFSTFGREIILYPMYGESRRRERKAEIYNMLSALSGKAINDSLLSHEAELEFLEGTGSLVMDYPSRTAFATLSIRTHPNALENFSSLSGFKTVAFEAMGPDNKPIYHTNVMMTMADSYCLIGVDTIMSKDRADVIGQIENLGKEIISLSNKQVYENFAGNMLQLGNDKGDKFLVMSTEAKRSLRPEQMSSIAEHNNEIIAVPINTIERIGGGSVRCMMAEFFSIHEED